MVESFKPMPLSNCKELLTLVGLQPVVQEHLLNKIKLSFHKGQGFSAWLFNFDPNRVHLSLYQGFSWDVQVTLQGVL